VDKLNNKGAFSIIAALLVAVVLIGTVMVAYSSIRYPPVQGQPQILTAVDETNQALKQLLGFTVGYYGSTLKVTGNVTYAQQLARNYLNSGLANVAYVKPEWGFSMNATNLSLNANWFTNKSYSQGNIQVTYDLNGLGIFGVSCNVSSRLEVQISNSTSPTQAQFKILSDNGEPIINLGTNNLKFYRYVYGNLTWDFSAPTNVISHADGTYLVDLPSGLSSNSYVVQVEDARGLMVLASSFSQFTSKLTWNSSSFQTGFDYVDDANLGIGSHSDYSAQQVYPDGVYDTLTEAVSGTFTVDNYPNSWNPIGSTSSVLGSLTDLQSDNGVYMQLRSYPTAFSSSYNTIGFDSQNSAILTSTGNSISWSHTTGTGNDRILLVSVDVFRSSNTPTTINSITSNGVALTQLATNLYNTDPRVRSYVFYLLNPSSGTNTITANFTTSTLAIGGSVTYTNVNQTTPILASNTASGSGTSQSVGVTASGTNSKVLFGHLGTYRTNSYTITDAQTTRWSQTGQQYKGYGSDKSVTSGSISTSWTTSNAASWVAIAVLLQPTQVGTAFNCEAEFTGSSNTYNWNNIIWAIDAAATTNGVSATYQLYNYRTGQYATTGDGYLTDSLGTTNTTKTQTITSSLTDYRDPSGNWKIKISTTQTTTVQFDIKLDIVKYSINEDNYALNLEEQWLNVNATNIRQDLCVKTGTMGFEPLIVQVWHGGSWKNLITLTPNYFNNVSLVPYIDSTTLAIRFVGSNDTKDPAPDSWAIDSVYIKDEPNVNFLVNLQQSTFTLEVLQNGTMWWLGQNLQLTTQTLPIPPIPVKAIRVNQTINGVNQEVPFQIEDWASNYQIPLGLTSNATIFSNRQMIVFLLDSKVTDFTVWWDGCDIATQTPMAFTNKYFNNDNTPAKTLSNGKITLLFGSFNVKSTVVGTGTFSTATFMRINSEASTYGAGLSYVIHHGIVRDIVQQEAEWGKTNPPADDGGAHGCPNLYANIILTLPANTNYYTYQLRIMFINSTQARSITDLSPIQLTTSVSSAQMQTENGTLAGFPLIQNGTGTFLNYASGGWTAHHFSQFISNDGKGAGIMFTDTANQKLYAFDSFSGSTSNGALKVSSGLLELLPVSSSQVQFTYAYDIAWRGAVATFDGATPLCSLYDGTTPTGLWILAEYPPTLTVTAKS
jgi:hypothetical protein